MGQVFSRRIERFLGWSLAGIFIVLCLTAWSPIAFSQIPSLPQSNTSQPPNGVTRQGLLEVTDVKLGGKEVLKIASPAVFNRSELGSQIPVEVRSHQIEVNLEQILRSNRPSVLDAIEERSAPLDPDTIQVYI
ncbi:MAG: mechanosensitive ion channel family protein, partial [Pseudanabaena sp. RU_4_16]|nr:mechanosensitive ion channel family protein [Pseudanabaena sp. RU_4_16]